MEKVTRLSNFQKKIDIFSLNIYSQKIFLKNNLDINKQEQNIRLNPKKNLCMKRPSKHNSD